MANKIISGRFTRCGQSATGLTPTINIWELHPTNPAIYIQVIINDSLTELFLGWYRYDFATYDFAKNYIFVIDGGVTLPPSERYQYGANESYEEDIAFEVWEENNLAHLNINTTGLVLNQIKADTTAIALNEVAIFNLLTYVRKLLSNRNRIDQVGNTLILYDDDKVTPLLVFDLKDFGGLPSINPIAERTPI